MAELVHEDVVAPVVVGSHGAELAEDAAAAIGLAVDHDLDEIIWRVLRQLPERAVVQGQDVTLAAKDVVARANGRRAVDAGGRTADAGFLRRHRQRPDIEVRGPLLERRHAEQVIGQCTRALFELAHFGGRIAIAQQQ